MYIVTEKQAKDIEKICINALKNAPKSFGVPIAEINDTLIFLKSKQPVELIIDSCEDEIASRIVDYSCNNYSVYTASQYIIAIIKDKVNK